MSVDLVFRDKVAVLTLNQPQALNVLGTDMIVQFGHQLDAVAASGARALLIMGEGGKAFSAGANVKELMGQDAETLRTTVRRGQLTTYLSTVRLFSRLIAPSLIHTQTPCMNCSASDHQVQ